jgi:uncharacterized membrane protein YozB (DUF420 family)
MNGEISMAKTGGAVGTGAAMRLVYTIGLIRWITLGLIAFGVLGGTVLGMASDVQMGGALSMILWVYGAVAGLVVYVFLGWLQQTLLMLIGIAKNTASDGLLSRL